MSLAGFALLGVGALQARHAYLTRGLPDGLPQPVNHGVPSVGLNVYLEQYDDAQLEAELTAIAATGVRALKQSFAYGDAFDWEASDRLIFAALNHGFTLVPLLDGDPASGFASVNPDAFAAWAGAFAARYGAALRYYIIWDEPNLADHWGGLPPNPIEYAALLTAAADAIRAADGDAVIVAAPLAPTEETGPANLADHLFLQRLYEAGAAPAFDVVAGKPYGFDTGPDDRRVAANVLNFSRAILLREVLLRHGDGHKAVWAGNWGWNALPAGWSGSESIWGAASRDEQIAWTQAAFRRARQEWPWMGVMFLENWAPDAPADDPRWGFSAREWLALDGWQPDEPAAPPGFHLASPDDPAQQYAGGWRFSPEFGADISQVADGQPPDEMRFTFWGTDVGLRVRRANFRARLYVTIDGQPANALPRDENGAMLILTAADPAEEYLSIEPIATGLDPGVHTLRLVASRGWDQWALNGFSVGYRPPDTAVRLTQAALGLLAGALALLAIRTGRRVDWATPRSRFRQLQTPVQLALTAVLAAFAGLAGWLTWHAQAEGIYRRLGDAPQLVLTTSTAAIFYVSPIFLVYAAALGALLLLISWRPAWGLALIAASFPLYVLPKPMLGYLFSPVEIFTLVTFAAVVFSRLTQWPSQFRHRTLAAASPAPARPSPFTRLNFPAPFHAADLAVLLFVAAATLSLLFTERLDVALNEWRVVIVEPALFYLLLRAVRPSRQEMWVLVDAFVVSGLLVAGYGLWQVTFDRAALITAEGGLLRLKSFFGSPNNVGLYLGRILPLLLAAALLGQQMAPRRRWAYAAAMVPIGLAILLSFSKGALILGVPAGGLLVFGIWMRRNGRSPWPWAAAALLLGAGALGAAQQVPALAGRLDLTGATGVFRLNLWQASVNMALDHPFTGVGLDNFLYAYRGRYILDAAWQEPNLNHPHNILLDFATRLGLLGLVSGGWLLWQLGQTLRRALASAPAAWQPVAAGCSGALAAMLAHGLVDHSFFLVDLAFVFYLLLGTAVWLDQLPAAPPISGR